MKYTLIAVTDKNNNPKGDKEGCHYSNKIGKEYDLNRLKIGVPYYFDPKDEEDMGLITSMVVDIDLENEMVFETLNTIYHFKR